MKLDRCPVCHSPVDVFALAKDEATSKLLAKLAKLDTLTGNALLDYLGLFTPAKTALSSSRALTLVTELETVSAGEWQRLGVAMATTVETIRNKVRAGEAVKPFKNHAYVQKVFDQTDAAAVAKVTLSPTSLAAPQKTGKTFGAMAKLEGMKGE